MGSKEVLCVVALSIACSATSYCWLFYYEPNEVTCLDLDFLNTLKFGSAKPDPAIIYADKCLLTNDE
ncbi:MAG: hypothetical protein WCG16_05460 [Methylococcales bacterium]